MLHSVDGSAADLGQDQRWCVREYMFQVPVNLGQSETGHGLDRVRRLWAVWVTLDRLRGSFPRSGYRVYVAIGSTSDLAC